MNVEDVTAPQPPPIVRPGGVSMHYVAATLHRLKGEAGLRKYGSLLQAGNGRNADFDRIQESLDGLVYELQRAVEAESVRQAVAAFRAFLAEEAAPLLDDFDAMFSPDALAARADAVAQRLIDEASRNEPERGGTG